MFLIFLVFFFISWFISSIWYSRHHHLPVMILIFFRRGGREESFIDPDRKNFSLHMESEFPQVRTWKRNKTKQNKTPKKYGVSFESSNILKTEPMWFDRGLKEAIKIKLRLPTLNRGGGRYNLPAVWSNLLKGRARSRLVGPPTRTRNLAALPL